ncbi:MAG: nicotinate-nucleotide--dimethylbenzimidazole phosphoribosyltransferase [Bacteroidota bacterium]
MISNFNIEPLNHKLEDEILLKIDSKTKPVGSLGKLEQLATQIALIQNTTHPKIENPHILVFASDHGIVEEGVSAYPQEVTAQMVLNFLEGGAAINVFARQHSLKLKVIDAGVKPKLPFHPNLIEHKIGEGTRNFLNGPAMTEEQCAFAIQKGSELIKELSDDGCNTIGLGEMGIGNTSSASLIMSVLCELSVEECVGRGAGIDDSGFKRKIEVLKKAKGLYSIDESNPIGVLSTYGGFEIVMMTGAYLAAAEHKMVVLVDGFIATSAFLVAYKMNPKVLGYAIFTHVSDESGHGKMLDYLRSKPLIDLGMRLGEGTGCAVAFPLVKSAVLFLNEMSSFESANVSNKTE